MMSDVCKHCHNAPCLEACPTGRAVQDRVRHGRGPAGHLQRLRLLRAGLPVRRDRRQHGRRQGAQVHALLRPPQGRAGACLRQILPDRLDPVRRACPTSRSGRAERVEHLHEIGVDSAYLYGTPGAPGATGDLGHLNAFFLLIDRPEVYNLPAAPTRPANRVAPSLATGLATVGGAGARERLPIRAAAG